MRHLNQHQPLENTQGRQNFPKTAAPRLQPLDLTQLTLRKIKKSPPELLKLG